MALAGIMLHGTFIFNSMHTVCARLRFNTKNLKKIKSVLYFESLSDGGRAVELLIYNWQ